ncbi:MAG: transglycosylase SLT domain-containing protein [SAR324 cluster bacterium]|nr:transglycosylase SLT domain-containing protein [SAR324 cluster bacterium]
MKCLTNTMLFMVFIMSHSIASGHQKYEDMIIQQSNLKCIDYNLALAIVEAESNFRPKVISYKGALGLGQVTILVAKDRLGYSQKDKTTNEKVRRMLLDPHQNIRIMLMHLEWINKHLSSFFEGVSRIQMIAAVYNAGYIGFVNSKKRLPQIGEGHKPLEPAKKRERDGYIKKVVKAYHRFVKKNNLSDCSLSKI